MIPLCRPSQVTVAMPTFHSPTEFFGYDRDTIFGRLNDRDIEWRGYHGDVPQSLALEHQRSLGNSWRYYRLERFVEDISGLEHEFPQYIFIEPNYLRGEQNDDHPPHSTLAAQQLLADVCNAIRGNQPLWESTLLVELCDEHGGFYVHVVSPAVVPPDEHHEEYSFDRRSLQSPAW